MPQTADAEPINFRASLVIVAGGLGRRMGTATPKPFLELEGRAVLLHTLDAFAGLEWIDERILVVPAALAGPLLGESRQLDQAQDQDAPDWQALGQALREAGVDQIISGGVRRQDSVLKGLQATSEASEVVLIHDAVRPFADRQVIEGVARTAQARGAAIPGVAVKDTIKRVNAAGVLVETPDRASLRAVQTPQGFRRAEILAAHQRFGDRDVTDDAALMELAGHEVVIVEGRYHNIKLTTPDDIPLALRILSERKSR